MFVVSVVAEDVSGCCGSALVVVVLAEICVV